MDFNVQEGRLSFATALEEAVRADAVFIAVGTPSRRLMGMQISPTSTMQPAKSQQRSHGFTVIITKSTVPVGTNYEVELIIHEARGRHVVVDRTPEFLREGA